MTTANKVTILRILLIPFFVVEILYYFRTGYEMHRILGVASFVTASILDGVDGYIARRFNQKSELGAILDPLADKLLLVSGIVLLSLRNQTYLKVIPLWLTATILSRDVLLLIGLGVIHIVCGKVSVRPRILGKIATVLQMVTVIWTLMKWSPRWLSYWTLGAAIFTGGSALIYLWDGMRQLSASPRSSPTPGQ
ncbi:MAG TPA: CDP-alcohol phosphatidyltransferase family protein [Verrucomicrobiae bacterium]|nr:CDP-alcohol phosphatidyltransferase family protein [Verrucomicrobiae bacterium]